MEENSQSEVGQDSHSLHELLEDRKRRLDAAVKAYEQAIIRPILNESEIRSAVDKCAAARLEYEAARGSNDQSHQPRPTKP